MKKIIVLFLSIFMLTACEQKSAQDDKSIQSERDSLLQLINQKNTELDDLMGLVNDIQQGFREINEAENRVALENNSPEKDSRAEIIENLSFIRKTMTLNRELIARLKQQLKTSSYAATKLQETIESMSAMLEEKTAMIQKLQESLNIKDATINDQSAQISTLNTNITDLSAENQEKAKTVEAQDKELHTAWYVFGTKKELKEQHILQNGDVLKSSTFRKDYFTQIDLRVTKVIKLYSKSAKLLTSHPSNSYSLDKDDKGQYTLRITNPQNFWSVSRYLVIVVK